MLQTVYKGTDTRKASSLYCVWVCNEPGCKLEAIWIDSEMPAFENQMIHRQEAETPAEGALEQSNR